MLVFTVGEQIFSISLETQLFSIEKISKNETCGHRIGCIENHVERTASRMDGMWCVPTSAESILYGV